MLDYIYQWIENIAFYLVIVVAMIQMVPGDSYKKYIRFFVGMILILMMAGPIFKIFDVENYRNDTYQEEMKKIEEIIIGEQME